MESRETPPNVLLVVLDSVRAHNCSLYGYERETTPFLQSIAEGATVFTQARAPSNWSLPCHASIFTGLGPNEHRLTVHDRLAAGSTVFERLADRGYDTGVFTENGFVVGHDAGFEHAFETVVSVPDGTPAAYDTADINPGPDGFYYAEAFTEWRRSVPGPWAACVNLMDAHRPFEPRAEFDRWGDDRARELQASLPTRWEWEFHGGARPYWQLGALETLYNGAIRQVDAILERVLSELEAEGVLDETLVVVCSDHGDGFGGLGTLPGEPPAVSHIVPMHETLLHVPLVVLDPAARSDDVVRSPATTLGFPAAVERALDGRPVAGAFVEPTVRSMKMPVTGDLRERFAAACERVTRFTAPSRAVYERAPGVEGAVLKRYYWGEETGTFRVDTPGAIERLGTPDREAVDAAFDEPREEVREPLQGTQVSAETRDQLAALGYY